MPKRPRLQISPLALNLVVLVPVRNVDEVGDLAPVRVRPGDVAHLPVAVEDVVAARRAGLVARECARDDVREVQRRRAALVDVVVVDLRWIAGAFDELAAVVLGGLDLMGQGVEGGLMVREAGCVPVVVGVCKGQVVVGSKVVTDRHVDPAVLEKVGHGCRCLDYRVVEM